jgi:hypothetical protein
VWNVFEGINCPRCDLLRGNIFQDLVTVEEEKGKDYNADDDVQHEDEAQGSERDGDGLPVKPFCKAPFEVIDVFYKALRVFLKVSWLSHIVDFNVVEF